MERSYVDEALATYAAGCNKAAAVMIGAAAEAMVLGLRTLLVERMNMLGNALPKGIKGWQVKTAFEALMGELASNQKKMPRPLAEQFDSFASASQLRKLRR